MHGSNVIALTPTHLVLEVIGHAAWRDFRFTLGYRDVEVIRRSNTIDKRLPEMI
jgi:hypothetical protein